MPVSTELADIQASEIDEIKFYCNDNGYSLSEKNDIDKLLKIFQSMELKHDVSHSKDGGFMLEIILSDKDSIDMNVFSNDITINGKYYRPDKDYCNEILNFIESYD